MGAVMLGFDFSRRIVSVHVESVEVCTYVFQWRKILFGGVLINNKTHCAIQVFTPQERKNERENRAYLCKARTYSEECLFCWYGSSWYSLARLRIGHGKIGLIMFSKEVRRSFLWSRCK